VSRRTRILRYGASIAVALVGVACGALIPGSAGGTAATVLVGIGLVGVVSLIFYEVGLTEDRERAAQRDLGERAEGERADVDGPEGRRAEGRRAEGRRAEGPPRDPGAPGEHQGGRLRPLDRRRGHRRRLP
jgi:hypothetical protein